MPHVDFMKLDPRAIEPRQAHPGEDAGWDLFALEDTPIPANSFAYVPSGIALAVPVGYYARIVGRSSTISKKGLIVVEAVSDAGYRGEQLAGVFNPGIMKWDKGRYYFVDPIIVEAGTSVAQIIIQEVQPVVFREATQLPPSARGTKGFGSSGA